MTRQLRILLVDDTEANLLLVSKFINRLGHQTLLARSGQEAITLFQKEKPDLVLMDVMMPEMNGYETTARIREQFPDKWVPIIFLTAKAQDADHVRGIQAGGDDYITKPVNLVILEARIKAITRIAEMQRQIEEKNEQLEIYREENEREQKLAKHLIEKITQYDNYEHPSIRLWNRPAKHFSGDVFLVARTPANEIHILLADGTGHGLSATLNVIPVVEVFYGMTSKGFAISSIAREINRKIKQLMPTERFVAATLASINLSDRIVHVWNGGNPPALFVNADGKILHAWKSVHPALGIFSEHEFDSTIETFHWYEPGQLIMCSDGLLEANNAAGVAFGQSRLEQLVATSPMQNRLEHLIQAVDLHMGEVAAHDDVSLAVVLCPFEPVAEKNPNVSPDLSETTAGAPPCRWEMSLRLTAAELKGLDVVPMLLGWMDQLHLHPAHRSQAFLIISELFNNALDHGILNLDSSLKFAPEGFDSYLETRRQRLLDLRDGALEIKVQCLHQQQNQFLKVTMKDSGSGFDFIKTLSPEMSANTRPSGRGLALVKHLCSKIEHAGNGNEISVYYLLN